MPLAPETAALHERLFTLDTHCDTPTARFSRPGWDFAADHGAQPDGSQIDLPRLRRGGVDALVLAVYTGQMGRSPAALETAHRLAMGHFEATHAMLRLHAGVCGLARTADEALALVAEGRRAFFLSIENSYPLGRDAGNVARFHGLGVRMLGLTHMLNNDVADASTDPRGPEWGGLSPLGREVVAECNRLGIVLDASHASDDALRGLFTTSRTPVVLSHSSCRAVCDHARNVDDGLLRDLAAQGGVIQMNALPVALGADTRPGRTEAILGVLMRYTDASPTPEVLAEEDRGYASACRNFPNPRVTLDDFLRHLDHAVEVAGIDHVGIGCDLDGGGGGFTGLQDVADYPNITAGLVARGWREADLAKLWGGNTLRVLRAAERFAAGMK